MTDKYLDKIYGDSSSAEKRAMFDDWAGSYDADLAENGYATPGRVANALRKHLDADARILDFGCGTGLSGQALRAEGFIRIDGMDPSDGMLAEAREKGIYRDVVCNDLGDETPIDQDVYDAITAIGVIGPGAAPASVFHILMKALPKGGKLGFSFNDKALAIPDYEAALCQWLDCGAACLLFKEHGPHLPGMSMKSTVYIVEKM